MPKQLGVALQSITCDKNGFGAAIKLNGNFFAETFQNVPDVDLRAHVDVFPFPNGPISISEGQTVPITTDRMEFADYPQISEQWGATRGKSSRS